MNRRDVIKNLAAGTLTLFVVPAALTSCEEDPVEPDNGNGDNGNGDDNNITIDLADPDYNSLASPGGFVYEGSLIVINTGDGFIALSSRCTHQGCTVSYEPSTGNLPCPCHGSLFSSSGAVLNGPAGAPLTTYPVTVEGDILTIETG